MTGHALSEPFAPRHPRITVSAASNRGATRTENQDSVFFSIERGLFAIADGVGGLPGGLRASRTAISSLADLEIASLGFMPKIEAVRERLIMANHTLYERGQTAAPPTTCATTIAAIVLEPSRGACIWAGDSRIYLLRRGRLQLLTTDHRTWIDTGTYPGGRAALTRAIGAEQEVDLELRIFDFSNNDALLLCSDGVADVLSGDEMRNALRSGTRAADTLVSAVRAKGGNDDASALVIQYLG
jgi:serine/threonine protein phosphatase PrpC